MHISTQLPAKYSRHPINISPKFHTSHLKIVYNKEPTT